MKTNSRVIRGLSKLYRGVLRRMSLSPQTSGGCSNECRCGTLRFEPLESREMLSATHVGTMQSGDFGCLGTLAYEADFEESVGAEWSTGQVDSSCAAFTTFLGRFGNGTVSAAIPTEPGQAYGLLFDVAVIDSWDNVEPFRVYVDGQLVIDTRFHSNSGSPDLRAHYGWGSGYTDSLYRDFGIHFTADASTTTIAFAASNLQSLGDESWGIDNVRLYEAVPGPTVESVEPSGHSPNAGEPIVVTLSEEPAADGARSAGTYSVRQLGLDKAYGGGDDTIVPVLADYEDGSTSIALRPATSLAANWGESDYFMNLGLMGDWVVSSDGATVRQQGVGGPSFFVSGDAWESDRFAGRISVDTDATDDDAIGLVVGFEPDAGGEPLSYCLLSWRAAAQDGAAAGLTLAKITGDGSGTPRLVESGRFRGGHRGPRDRSGRPLGAGRRIRLRPPAQPRHGKPHRHPFGLP